MPFINFTNTATLLLALILFLLTLFLGKETHKSEIPAIMLFVFLILLICHAIELGVMPRITDEVRDTISKCLLVDFIFIFLSFISYLWIDDVQAKVENKKSIDNSLDWFWKRV